MHASNVQIFFASNHQIFARWLCRNYDNSMNIRETHPGLLEKFESGALSVRRTEKHFCRSLIDLALEQTNNADAANQHHHIQKQFNARQIRLDFFNFYNEFQYINLYQMRPYNHIHFSLLLSSN